MKNKIKFIPQNIELEIPSNKSVMKIAHDNGIPIQSSCKGQANCGECRVIVAEGENQILPPTSQEISLIGQGYHIDQRRLSCQLYCFGDVTIDVSDHFKKDEDAVIHKFLKRIKKDGKKKIHSIRDNLIEDEKEIKEWKNKS